MHPTMINEDDHLNYSHEAAEYHDEPSLWCFKNRRWSLDQHDDDDDDDEYEVDEHDDNSFSSTETDENNDGAELERQPLSLPLEEQLWKRERVVRFSTVEIREHDIVLGDHPFCNDGLALSLDWTYDPHTIVLDANARRTGGEARRLSYVERKLRLSTCHLYDTSLRNERSSLDHASLWNMTRKLESNTSCWDNCTTLLVTEDTDEDNSPPPDLEPLSFMSQAA